MTSTNTPCTKPEICGVKTHRPGTVAPCMIQGSRGSSAANATLTATPTTSTEAKLPKGVAMYLHEWVPAMALDAEVERCAEGIVNGYDSEEDRDKFEDDLMNRLSELGAKTDEEHWVAFNRIIADKENGERARPKPDDTRPFGNEVVTRSEFKGQPALRINAAGRRGYVVEGESGELTLMTDFYVNRGEGLEKSLNVRKDAEGDLVISNHRFPDEYKKLKDVREGRDWFQDEEGEVSWDSTSYEMANRLYANPVTRRYLETHATDPNSWDGE